jgi:hypothetical protein
MPPSLCTLTLALLASAVTLPAYATPLSFTRIRCLEQRDRRLFEEAVVQSPTVRRLAERIEHSDLVVFVRVAVLGGEMVGTTQMMAAPRGARYLRVTLDGRAAPVDMVARLGHEFQHVAEIADAPDVKDDDGMRALFKRIGWRSGWGDRWETQDAIETGRRVAREVVDRPTHVVDLVQAR